MTGVRLAVRYLAAMAALIALWAWPATGAPLRFAAMLAPPIVFLPGALFNAMLLHLGYAALRGRIARRWLALPALVYGGWAAFAGAGYLRARALRHEIEASAAIDYARVPAQHPALLLMPDDPRRDESGALAAAFAGIGADAEVYAKGERWRPAGAVAAAAPSDSVRIRIAARQPQIETYTDGFRLAAPRETERYDVAAAGHLIGHAASGRIAHPFPVPLAYFSCDTARCHAGLATLSLAYGARDGANEDARKAAYLVGLLGLKRTKR